MSEKKKRSANPLANIPNGTKQIYLDKDRSTETLKLWKCRVMRQAEPENPRSRKVWCDIDLSNDKEKLTRRYPKAEVFE